MYSRHLTWRLTVIALLLFTSIVLFCIKLITLTIKIKSFIYFYCLIYAKCFSHFLCNFLTEWMPHSLSSLCNQFMYFTLLCQHEELINVVHGFKCCFSVISLLNIKQLKPWKLHRLREYKIQKLTRWRHLISPDVILLVDLWALRWLKWAFFP